MPTSYGGRPGGRPMKAESDSKRALANRRRGPMADDQHLDIRSFRPNTAWYCSSHDPENRSMRTRLSALVAGVALVLAACSSSGATAAQSLAPSTLAASTTPASARPAASALTIYGASSLKAVLAKVKAAYETANPGTTLTISTDSSTALETQIEQGAPADVFLSADTTNPQKLVAKGLASGSPLKFAG